MIWLLYALGSAIFNATSGLAQKRISSRAHPLLLSLLLRLWTLPVIVLLLLFSPQSWGVQPEFWRYLLICSTLTVLGTYLTFLAFRLTDFSLTFPLLNLTPALALGTAWLINRDQPTILGGVGVILIVGSSYVLASTNRSPVKSRSSHQGMLVMSTVALIYSVTSVYDKAGIATSSPLLWTLGLNVSMAIILLCFLPFLPKLKKDSRQNPSWTIAFWAGTAAALTTLFQMLALQHSGQVPYVLAIKQFSVIIALLASWKVLRERPVKTRLWSGSIMTIGAILIALS